MTAHPPHRLPEPRSDVVAEHLADHVAGRVDHGLVRAIRREIAEKLAAQLQVTPVPDLATRQELCRALLADELARRTRAGSPPVCRAGPSRRSSPSPTG